MICRTILSCLASAAWACAPVPARAAEDAALQPAQMVRSLQLIQDRVAAGDHAALPMQRKILEMIDARLRAGTDEELSKPAGFRATLVYAMSGGNPATLETIVDRLHLSEEDSRKAIGVMSYLNGSTKAAGVALGKVDPMKELPEIGAFLALVKGSVMALEDPKGSLKLLDQARLLSPGTLVEEAALRRSIPIAASDGQSDRFLLASEQYVRTFLRSPYASQFADSFVAGVVALHETIDLARLETIIGLMTPEQQQVIYLRIARRSAIDGLTALSTFASDRTTVAAAPAEADTDPRALLYATLASVATEPVDTLKGNLARIDRSLLSAGDLKLLDAVTAVSQQIASSAATPDTAVAFPQTPAEAALPADAAPQPADASPTPKAAMAPEPVKAMAAAAEAPPMPAIEAVAAAAPVQAAAAVSADAAPKPVRQIALPGAPAPEAAPLPQTAAAPQSAPAPEALAAPEATPAPALAAATSAPQVAAMATQEAAAPVPADPADIALAEGRKKLDEIDALLAKAAK